MHLKRLLAALLLLTTIFGASATQPKREFRSIWMAAMNIDWPRKSGYGDAAEAAIKQELITFLDNFKKHNFTGVCIHVRPLADALYKSSYEPWSASITGTRGLDPGWDPLAFAVEECHKRGLECYAWVNPFRIDHHGKVYTTPQDLEWRANGWELKSGNWTIFNPAIEGARKHCLDVIKEIYTNYNIDGMLFDDYFYPGDGMQAGSAAGDYQLWKDSGTSMSIEDWRRNNVNTFVKQLYDMIQADRPDMRFGIGPAGVAGASASKYGLNPPSAGSDWMYSKIYCDPLAWLNDGSIDFISPQIYWARTEAPAYFTPLCQWWSDVAKHFGRHNYVSMASYKVDNASFGGNNETGWGEFEAQIDLCRNFDAMDAPGQIYYSASYFDGPTRSGLGNYLEQTSYAAPSLVPVVDWKDHKVYDAPAALSYSNGKLSWRATETAGKAIVRYTVYAVPTAKSLEEAMAEDGDGLDVKYLQGVTYDANYTVDEAHRGNYWYAVCVYDGYGWESQPALYNYTGERSAKPELVGPAHGTVVPWDVTLTWKAVAGANYIAEVALSPDFERPFLSADNLTSGEVTFDLSNLPNNTLCYWRIIGAEPSKIQTPSDTRTFFSPTRTVSDKPELLAPQSGTVVTGKNVEFKWTAVADAESYYVAVARSDGFDTPVYADYVDASSTSISVPVAALGTGNFVWRVITHGRRFNSAISDEVAFTVADIEPGTYETGYRPHTDGATYPEMSDMQLRNLWVRSTDDAQLPLSFENDGAFNLGMTANEDFVYVSGRTADNKNAGIYLRQYDAKTGELIRELTLDASGAVANLPCNDVIKDSAGHICITNMSTLVLSRPIYIHMVDMISGALTQVAALKGDKRTAARVDHIAINGDVTTGNFTVFGAIASKNYLISWTVTDDEEAEPECRFFTADAMYPTGAANFGEAPRLTAVDDNMCYVDGGLTVPTLYDFSTGKAVASLSQAPGMETLATELNGFSAAQLADGGQLVAFVADGATSKWMIAKMSEPNSPATLSALWTVEPFAATGNVRVDAPVDVVAASDGRMLVYVYAPGRGLACYEVASTSGGVNDAVADTASWTVEGRKVKFAAKASEVSVYTLAGAKILAENDVDCVELPAAGSYIISADGCARVVTVR